MKSISIEQIRNYIGCNVEVQHLNYKSNYNGNEYGILNGVYPLYNRNKEIFWQYTTDNNSTGQSLESCKLVLIQMSDIENYFNLDAFEIPEFREFVGGDWCDIYDNAIVHIAENINDINISALPFKLIEWLLINKFDIYGLIKLGLAIDINNKVN